MAPECLAALGCSLRQSLVAINLKGTDFAKAGRDLSGFRVFCSAIANPSFCGLKSLELSNNKLKPDALKVLAEVLESNRTITSLRCAAHSSVHFAAGRQCLRLLIAAERTGIEVLNALEC